MQMQKLAVKEQIVKTVVRSGNGGAVWVPKNWLGKEVIVILPEKPELEVKEKIIHLLEPYLKDIVSVSIYGSYARKECAKESDIDVLVLTKDKNIKLDFKKENLDVTVFPVDKFRKAMEKHPAIYYQIIREAEPLINACIIDELKIIKINKENFREYLDETKEHIKSNKEFIELDKLDGMYLTSYSALYSSLLRLRALFIIKCILGKELFLNKKFKAWLMDKGITAQEFRDCYEVYRRMRTQEGIIKNLKIKIKTVEKIIELLEKECALLEAKL